MGSANSPSSLTFSTTDVFSEISSDFKGKNNNENKKKFTENVIDNLIEEELKFQEAKKLNPNIIFQAEKKALNLLEINFMET